MSHNGFLYKAESEKVRSPTLGKMCISLTSQKNHAKTDNSHLSPTRFGSIDRRLAAGLAACLEFGNDAYLYSRVWLVGSPHLHLADGYQHDHDHAADDDYDGAVWYPFWSVCG